jgi:hypothetical protein
MAANPASKSSIEWLGSAIDIVPLTPNDATDLAVAARAIRCDPTGVGGTLRITTLKGEVRNTHIAAGELLIVGAKRVHSTGTAATLLEALI